MTLIPFLHQLSQAREAVWIDAFTLAAPELTLRPLRDLSEREKATATLAVLGDAKSDDLDALPNLVWAQNLWAGVNGIVDQCAARNIGLTRMVDPDMARTLSEYVSTAALTLHRDFPTYTKQQAHAEWVQHTVPLPESRTIGVLGLGEIGTVTAKQLAMNGFEVWGWARSQKDIADVTCLSGEDGLTRLLSHADMVVLLLPLTDATENLVDASFLSKMKQGASLINVARGGLIDDAALLSALDGGGVGHAVLDVFREEPLPLAHPFWQHPNVTVTPHVAATTRPETAAPIAAANIRAFLDTDEMPDVVSPKRGY